MNRTRIALATAVVALTLPLAACSVPVDDTATATKPAAGAKAEEKTQAEDAEPAKDEAEAPPVEDEKATERYDDGPLEGMPTLAARFKDMTKKTGTPQQQDAVAHVTQVQEEVNGIMDTADVHTDYTGGMLGPHAADGKLIASAYANWRDSNNGLVTVYDANGEILSNGNY